MKRIIVIGIQPVMEPPRPHLEYASAPPARKHPWWRYLLAGPILGATIGAIHTTTAALIWVWYGEPDFYFRGWGGVDLSFDTDVFLGFLGGLCLGGGLVFLDLVVRRRLRLLLYMIMMPAIAVASFGILTYLEFRRHDLFAVLWEYPGIATASIVVAIALSRRDRSDPPA